MVTLGDVVMARAMERWGWFVDEFGASVRLPVGEARKRRLLSVRECDVMAMTRDREALLRREGWNRESREIGEREGAA